MKKSELQKALKIFNAKFGCKLKITKFETRYGDHENHYPFDGGEDLKNLQLLFWIQNVLRKI